MATVVENQNLAMFHRSLQKVDCHEEIISFIESLISERDELLRRQEHLHSLSRLYEKMVSDADDIAAQITKEARDKMETETKAAMSKAEERAQQIQEETRTRAISEAQEEVRNIKSKAERDFEAVLQGRKAMMQAQMKELADRLYQQMLNEAEESKQRLEAFMRGFEDQLSSLQMPTWQVGGSTKDTG